MRLEGDLQNLTGKLSQARSYLKTMCIRRQRQSWHKSKWYSQSQNRYQLCSGGDDHQKGLYRFDFAHWPIEQM